MLMVDHFSLAEDLTQENFPQLHLKLSSFRCPPVDGTSARRNARIPDRLRHLVRLR
jgi:hypothetical protein